MELSLTVNEVIIEFVRENHCLYDKRDADFKNTRKKKDLWQKLSENLKNFYTINMSAEEIEKRWSSLRDMFNRENRRQTLPPSGSGYEPKKEWELYRNMLFLVPHITHRKTKTSFVQQSQSSLLETSTADTSSPFTYKQSSNVFLSIKENTLPLDIESQESAMIIADCEILNRPASTLSSCSDTSSMQSLESSASFNPTQLKKSSVFKPIKKVMPEMDEFAKRKKMKDNQLDHELEKASKEISVAMKAVSSQLENRLEKDGYMSALEEGLKYVPLRNRTQCIIDLLQIIQKYEQR